MISVLLYDFKMSAIQKMLCFILEQYLILDSTFTFPFSERVIVIIYQTTQEFYFIESLIAVVYQR